MEEIYLDYIIIAHQIKELEAKKSNLALMVLDKMQKEGISNVKTDVATITLAKRTNYIFSEKVKLAKEKVKALEEKEKASGKIKTQVIEYTKVDFKQLTEEGQ